MNSVSRSPLEYQRVKDIREKRDVPRRDQAETALPGTSSVLPIGKTR